MDYVIKAPQLREDIASDVRPVIARNLDDPSRTARQVISVDTSSSPNDPLRANVTEDARLPMALMSDTDGKVKAILASNDNSTTRDIPLKANQIFPVYAKRLVTETGYLGNGSEKIYALFPPSQGAPEDVVTSPPDPTAAWSFESNTAIDSSNTFSFVWDFNHITPNQMQIRRLLGSADPDEATNTAYMNSSRNGFTGSSVWFAVPTAGAITMPAGWLWPDRSYFFAVQCRNSDNLATGFSDAVEIGTRPATANIDEPTSGLIDTAARTFAWSINYMVQRSIQVRRWAGDANVAEASRTYQFLSNLTGAFSTQQNLWINTTASEASFSANYQADGTIFSYQLRGNTATNGTGYSSPWSSIVTTQVAS